tara:strand:- start:3319 stop:3696 length:378 start_codon:yes stop_codon:yes gene_type:complete
MKTLVTKINSEIMTTYSNLLEQLDGESELSFFENQCELIYTALHSYQNVTLEQGKAIRSVISSSDMAYEWWRASNVDFCENVKYFGVTIDDVKFYIKKDTLKFVNSLNNYRHQINTLRKGFRIAK